MGCYGEKRMGKEAHWPDIASGTKSEKGRMADVQSNQKKQLR